MQLRSCGDSPASVMGTAYYEAPGIEMVPAAIAASLRFLSGIDMKNPEVCPAKC